MSQTLYARVDENGQIVLPPDLAQKLGLQPGDEIRVMLGDQSLRLRPSITTLRRVYVEVTNQCNLNCSTCMRNVWDVEYGSLPGETFERILADLDAFPQKPELFFGGYGEPLSNPACLDLLAGDRVAGVIRQAGIIHLRYRRVLHQPRRQ